MNDGRAAEITLIPEDWNNGDARLPPFVYKESKRG
jgi:hypothetical protein